MWWWCEVSNKHAHLFNGIALKEMGEAELLIQIMSYAQNKGFEEKMLEAITIASICHRGQLRANRSTLPRDTYLTHPLRNTLRLIRAGITDQEVLIASVLHDVVEDGAEIVVNFIARWTANMSGSDFERRVLYRRDALDYIGDEFGYGVKLIVERVSNPLEEVKPPKEGRVARYIKHLNSVMLSDRAALVKISDLIDNGAGLHHNVGSMPPAAYKHLSSKYLLALPIALDTLRTEQVQAMFTSVPGYQKLEKNLVDGITRLQMAVNQTGLDI